MGTKVLSWNFPQHFLFLRIEAVFIALLAVLVFFFSYIQFARQWFPALALTILFLGLYFLISQWVNAARRAEEQYQATPTHFEVVRKTRFGQRKEKVPWHDISHHRLDKFFLGGYLLSKRGKHLLFFNTRQELNKFEALLKKHWKKK